MGEGREVRALGRAGIEHLRNVRVVHEGQGLSFGFEAGDDFARVHAELDDLKGDATSDRFGLLGHVDHAAAAFAEFLEEFIAANVLANGGVGEVGRFEGDGGSIRVGLAVEDAVRRVMGGKKHF
jgi:hypothetical protein